MFIEALASGGGSDWYYTVLVKAPVGANITVDDGDEEVTAVGAGVDTLIGIPVHNPSSAYTVSVEMDGFTAPTRTVNTPATSGGISTELTFNFATINMTYDDEFRGQTATITDGTHTQTATLPAAPSNLFTVHVPYTGDWRISAEDSVDHQLFYTSPDPIPITSLTQTSNVNMFVIPNGETVLPVNDIETWLLCADIKNTGYTTLAEVLADEDVLFKVLTDDNANKYLKRSTEWAVNPGLVPDMTDATHPSGEVSASGYVTNDYLPYHAFDGDDNTTWQGSSSVSGSALNEWIQYKFDTAKIVRRLTGCIGSYLVSGATFQLQASNTGSFSGEEVVLKEFTSLGFDSGNRPLPFDVSFENDTAYSYFRIKCTNANGGYTAIARNLQFYERSTSITENELAMQIIGADDFASDILLSDATWAEAICESEYWEDVLNGRVPTMTSDTTPSGEASASSINNIVSSPYCYLSFDGQDNSSWMPTEADTTPYLQYDFGYPILVKKIYLDLWSYRWTSSSMSGISFEASNDPSFSSSVVLKSNISVSGLPTTATYAHNIDTYDIDDNTTAYRYYRLKFSEGIWHGSPNGFVIPCEVQYYGREAGGVQTLLKAAGISRPYTTIDELLADHVTLQKVISSHDAIDYLVTAKSFIDAITSDATAMRYIGKRNYAADTLLADEEWANAIVDSDYRKSILNIEVPVMTNNTTPEGECFGSGIEGAAYDFYKAFDGDDRDTSAWYNTHGVTTNGYVGYHFTKPVKIYHVRFKPQYNSAASPTYAYVKNWKIQISDDNVDWSKEIGSGSIAQGDIMSTKSVVVSNPQYCNYARLFALDTWAPNSIAVITLQFYGREDVDENYIDIYSAASDNDIHYLDNTGNPVTIAATDTDGHGTIQRANLPNGIYTLYSSVAKNPNDLTEDYFKTVKVENDTIEIMLMPDDALYWYGCKVVEWDTTGYKTYNSSSYIAGSWTLATNKMTAPMQYTTFNSKVTPTQNRVKFAGEDKLHAIKYNGTGSIEHAHCELNDYTSNNLYLVALVHQNSSDTQGCIAFSDTKNVPGWGPNVDSRINLGSYTTNYNNRDIYAMWLEKYNKQPTYLSAANDTLYIKDGNTKIPIATTNGEGKSFDALLEPGTYEIYSSVAKDPDNLSNPYSKTVTITADTICVPVMPDNVIYWWGYNNGLEHCETNNGWVLSGYSFGEVDWHTNDVTTHTDSGAFSYVGTKKSNNHNYTNVIYKGVRFVNNVAGEFSIGTAKNALNSGAALVANASLTGTTITKLTLTNNGSNVYAYGGSAAASAGRTAEIYAVFGSN